MAFHAPAKIVNSEAGGLVWRDLESFVDRIMFEPTWGTDIPSLVTLYTAVHDHCTSQKVTTSAGSAQSGEAPLLGGDLYRSLVVYLQAYLDKLKKRLGSFPKQRLVARYFEESAHYVNVAQILNHVFRYLNRHWIKRELDQGMTSTYNVYTLHLVLWHSELFSGIHEDLTDALSELVEAYRRNENIEVDGSGHVRPLIESIVSIQPCDTGFSGSARDFYGFLLETPWRDAIEEACAPTNDLPQFLYPRPTTAIAHIEEDTSAQLKDLLASLAIKSGVSQLTEYGGGDGVIVKLVTEDNIIEVDQRTAECSFLLKHLFAYFGPNIIARELIPIPNVSGTLLYKVLEWCEHHKDDANTQSTSDVDSNSLHQLNEMKSWDEKYFEVDQKLLFEIILAANYLDIQPLLDAGCKTVANMIKGKSPEEIRTTFNITNEFTAEEEDQIRREYEWAEDRDYDEHSLSS